MLYKGYMNKLILGSFLVVFAIALFIGGSYFANGDLTFLKQYVPSTIVDGFNLPVLFFIGFTVVGVTIVAKGAEVYE